MNNNKLYCVTYYNSDNNRVLVKTCRDRDEMELFRSYLSRHTGLDELNSLVFTIVNVGSTKCVYDIIKL